MAIGDKKELDGIKEVLNYYETGSLAIEKRKVANQRKAQKELNDEEERLKKNLYRTIAEYQIRGLIKTNEEAAKLSKAELLKQQSEKLESEKELLELISKKNQEELNKKNSYLEKEIEIIKDREAGDEKAAKQKEKELKNQKKKDNRKETKEKNKEEGNDIGFLDSFKNAFSDFTKEVDMGLGAATKKTASEDLVNVMKGVGKAITEGLNAINNAITSYAKYQTSINARLQGINSFSDIADNLNEIAFSPLLKADDLYANVSEIVGQGIATNVEQRAFFATVKDGIASTFDVTNQTMNRLIRIQQTDSTAARLGMEGYLTKFLNTYVENTEYLTTTFDSVATSLFEASTMLGQTSGVNASAEFEYIVQKWLGTLTGVGLSDTTAQNIADAIGKIGSGDTDVLNSEIGTLLTMSASSIGENIGEMLNDGLDATDTNKLLEAMVNYLQTIADTGTNVTKSELSKVFGVTVSDLVAVTNLQANDIKKITNDLLSTNDMYGELRDQFDVLPERLGIANILENLFSNLTYQTGMDIASNAASFATWKITDLISNVTGGIALPFISAFGNGFDFNTTVENLIKTGIVGGNMLGNIGNIISGTKTVKNGSTLLDALSIKQGTDETKTFGEGLELTAAGRKKGKNKSETTYVGNSDDDVYYDSAVNNATNDAEKKLKAKQEDYADPVVEYLEKTVKFANKMEALMTTWDTVNTKGLRILTDNAVTATDATVDPLTSYLETIAKSATNMETLMTAWNNISTKGLQLLTDKLTASNSTIEIDKSSIETNINSQISAQVDSVSQTLSQVQNMSQILSQVQDTSQTIMQAQDALQTPPQTQDMSQIASQAQNISQTLSQAQDVSQLLLQNQDMSQIQSQAKDISQVLSQAQDVSQMFLQAENMPQISLQMQNMSEEVLQAKETLLAAQDRYQTLLQAQNASEYEKYLAEAGLNQTNSNLPKETVSSVDTYLNEIDFGTGFKSLVENVAKIVTKLNATPETISSEVSGFSQYPSYGSAFSF